MVLDELFADSDHSRHDFFSQLRPPGSFPGKTQENAFHRKNSSKEQAKTPRLTVQKNHDTAIRTSEYQSVANKDATGIPKNKGITETEN